jgi:3-hydroxyacyl-[acyl-carrier-protein] dehydratase
VSKALLSIEKVRELLPHRYPILLVDRVLELSADTIVAEKLVSANEPFFQGHFPQRPIMPGVLMIEALAQAGGLMVRYNESEALRRGVALAGVDKARFRRPVGPGDVLVLEVRLTRRRGNLIVFSGTARVDGEMAAEAEILAAIVDWESPA